MGNRNLEIWEARKRGETVADLGARFDLSREKVAQICTLEQAREQARCDAARCHPPVHEPPCPNADPIELALAEGTKR